MAKIPPPPSPELDLQLGLKAKQIRIALKPSTYFWGESKSSAVIVNPMIAQRFLVEEIGQMCLPLTLIIIYAIVKMFMVGINLDSIFLIAGSILSVVTAFIVSMHIIGSLEWTELKGTKNIVKRMTLISFVPYFFGLYLIMYQGLYLLFTDFSTARILKSIMFILLGHWVIKKIRMVQEFHTSSYGQIYDRYINSL